MADRPPICNCHGCRFEKPALEARVAALEKLLTAHRAEFLHAFAGIEAITGLATAGAGARCLRDFEQEILRG